MTLIDKAEALAAIEAWFAETKSFAPPSLLETIAALPPAKQEHVADSNARGVGVKPLQWNDAAFLEQYAKSAAGTYRVFEKDGLWRATVHTVDDAHFVAETECLHDAQAAAQADYEARILAALAPTDAAQAREAALREAAALCDKPHHEGGLAKSLAFFARVANHAFYRQGCEEYRDAILALLTESQHDLA